MQTSGYAAVHSLLTQFCHCFIHWVCYKAGARREQTRFYMFKCISVKIDWIRKILR